MSVTRNGAGRIADVKGGSAPASANEVATRAIRELVEALVADGIDEKTIAVSLYAAATHEMIAAYGRDDAGKLAAQMYMRGYLA